MLGRIQKKGISLFLAVIMVVSMLYGATGKMYNTYAAGGTVAEVVALASSQVGYHEKATYSCLDDFTANSGSANYTKYARDVGVSNGQAWCAVFIWWCMKYAGVPFENYPSRTTVTRDWFVQRGQYHARGSYVPKPGDYVVFGNVSHCGIVESVSGYTISVIEGNSGDKVSRNYYNCMTSTYVTGFGTIQYNEASSSSSATGDYNNPGAPYPIPTINIRNGSQGEQVKWVQKFGNDIMGSGLVVDGISGAKTVAMIRQFQSSNGLTVDGIAGTLTINKMLEIWRGRIAQANPTPVNMGDEFCGLILRTDIWKSLRNNSGDVMLWDEKGRADYYWRFLRQSDGSYKIESLYNGHVLDAVNAGTDNCTNVVTNSDKGTDNQRWYIYKSGNGYKLVPKHAQHMSLDVYCAGSANGANIEIYQDNGTVAQIFSIYICDYSALTGISIPLDYKQNMYVGEEQTLQYTLNPSRTQSNIVTWSSSNTAVADVDGNGKITAKSEGTATIKCISTYNSNIYGTAKITVIKKEEPTTEEKTTEVTTETTENQLEEKTTEVTTEATEEQPEEKTTEVPTETAEEQPEEKTTEVTTEATENEPEEKTTGVTTETTENEPEEKTTEVESGTTENPTEEKPTEEQKKKPSNKKTSKQDTVFYPDSVGSLLEDEKLKCVVEVTSDDIKNPTVKYVESTKSSRTSITIPDVFVMDGIVYKVTAIDSKAFANNKKLTKVTIGNNVVMIGKQAFYNCKNLKTVVISNSVTTIKKEAFKNCKKLKKITIKSKVIKKIESGSFNNLSKTVDITVPKQKMNSYKKLLKKAGYKGRTK